MQNYTNKALGLFVVFALALAVIPMGTAQTSGFGRVVTPSTPDTTYVLAAGGPATFCYVDTDGSATFSPTEPVYLQAACGALIAGSVRVANPSTGTAGSQVTGTDADIGRVTIATGFATSIGFFDANGDGRFSATGNDVLYNDAAGALVVSIGDVILSGPSAGTVVTGTTVGLNNVIGGIASGTMSFLDSDNNGAYSLNDMLVYDGPGAGAANLRVGVGDVILSAPNFGKVGSVSDNFVTYNIAVGGPATFCYVDTDGSATFSPTEPVYLQAACGALLAGSVRIANPSTGTAGSQVTGTDADIGRVTIATGFASSIGFFDANGDGRFSAAGNDILYNDAAGAAVVSIGDVILSGTNAGTVVTGTTPGLNNVIGGIASGTMSFFDADNNGAYSLNDGLYYDGPGAGVADLFATVGDVQLSGAAPTGGHGGSGTTSTTGTTTSGTGTTTSGTGTTTSGTGTGNQQTTTSQTTTTKPKDTPGFELAVLVAALGAALILVRRKL